MDNKKLEQLEKRRIYRLNNKEKINLYANNYYHKKYENDETFKEKIKNYNKKNYNKKIQLKENN